MSNISLSVKGTEGVPIKREKTLKNVYKNLKYLKCQACSRYGEVIVFCLNNREKTCFCICDMPF